MSKFRTFILGVAMVLMLILTFRFVSAHTEVAANPASQPASIFNNDASTNPYHINFPIYRTTLSECFDVPLWQVASCRHASQTPARTYRSSLDECFDVPISEVARCRVAHQASLP
jgi:hypothetical protein